MRFLEGSGDFAMVRPRGYLTILIVRVDGGFRL